MKLLKIKPYDNTFFRLGHNFEKNISNVIQTKNIAYTSTFLGAIFTAILSKNDDFRNKFLDKKPNKDHLRILNINQIYLYDEGQGMTYIKAPKDLFIDRNVKYGKFKEIKKGESSIGYPYYLEEPEGDKLKRADCYFVSIKDFYEKYKYRVFDKTDFKHENDIFIKNSKTGISIEKDKKRVKESHLYTIEQTEFRNTRDNIHGNDWSFIVEYEIDNEFVKEKYNLQIEDLDKGELKLGGETKVCSYNVIDNDAIQAFKSYTLEEKLESGEKLKVILTGDIYFTDNIKKIFNDELVIKGLVNDKPIYIGGFDIATKKEKVMYKGYGAGTVILLQNLSEHTVKIREYIDSKLTDKSNLSNRFNQYIYIKGE